MFLVLFYFEGSLGMAVTVDQWTVIGTIGKWLKAPNNITVLIGMTLKPGDVVEVSPIGSRTASLTILSGDTPKTYACDDPDSLPDKSNAGCAHPIAVASETPEAEGPLTNLFRQVRQLIARDSTRYYTAASRDTGSLTDSVIRATSDSVELHPVVSGLNRGDYSLTIQGLSNSASSPSSMTGGTFLLHWDPGAKQAATGPQLAPGLYRLSAQSSDGDSVGEAWALVVTSENYEEKATSFEAIKKRTEGWNQNVPAAAVRAVIRAALDELSR